MLSSILNWFVDYNIYLPTNNFIFTVQIKQLQLYLVKLTFKNRIVALENIILVENKHS
jgi:hypothetical protein